MFEVPITRGKVRDRFNCTLGDHKYRFKIQWMTEVQAWFIGVEGLTTDKISFSGKRLSVGFDLFEPHARGLGILTLLGPERTEPTLDTLGDTHKLYWISESELLGP